MRSLLAILILAVVFPAAIADAAMQAADATPIPAGVDAAVAKGLAFLAKQQDRDGSYDGGRSKAAMTGLSLLAFLSAGDVPDLGRYGLAVRKSVDWLLAHQAADGYFGSGEHGLYVHAVATLALAEAQGVESGSDPQGRIHAALLKAVAVILAAQEAPKSQAAFNGGWRSDRNSPDSDLFLTGWNVLALRAAEEAGIPVPERAFSRAAGFVKACYDAKAGGFAPQPGGTVGTGSTAIGMYCLYLLGHLDQSAAMVDACSRYLHAHRVDGNTPFAYHAAYFVTQAMFQRGGGDWSVTGRDLLERLAKVQQPDGGWPQSGTAQEQGRVYATAMAVQSLTVPYRLLPLDQR